ncbi:hypothetical protein AVEN_172564-1 [Araneus ventricosus]|uniref:Uncharacterized protein n=1 Tax=Araneus ventricosus TaxID=182803 RepID=A0A4Y2KSS1_ARAVE|nr:hypothetical protein AVEN_228736-1 [Araneus ventricosus]GBN05401.1 hypothetical protein AVEN_172564-1 [Araneus ventricosus]
MQNRHFHISIMTRRSRLVWCQAVGVFPSGWCGVVPRRLKWSQVVGVVWSQIVEMSQMVRVVPKFGEGRQAPISSSISDRGLKLRVLPHELALLLLQNATLI